MIKLLCSFLMLFSFSHASSLNKSWEEIKEFQLKIRTIPEDANVYLDGKVIQDDEVKLRADESHILKVIHPDFLSKQVEVSSPDGKDMKLEVELEPRSSSVEFVLSPKNTVIEINGVITEPIDGKIHLSPGRYLFRYMAPQHYPQIDEMVIGINKDYQRTIDLTYNDPNLPPSSKKLTFRLDYYPYIYQNKEGWLSPIPLQMNAEYKYLSMGMGFYWLTQKDEKYRQGQSTLLSREDHYDLWGELRIISPYYKKIKVNGSLIYGNRISKSKAFGETASRELIQSYSGMGLGMRYYFVPMFSIQFQAQQLGMKNRETQKVRFEARSFLGFSFEF